MQLTTGPLDFYMPVPSLDGKRLFVIGVQERGELLRYDTRLRELRPYLSGIWADQLDFSPDGQWVAYIARPEGTLWRSRRDGSERLQLTSAPMWASMPRWSPDGSQIVFIAAKPGKHSTIYGVSAEGGALQELLSDEQAKSDPVWSPDGKSLAYGQEPWGQLTNIDIKVLDVTSHKLRTLPNSEGLCRPGWSPNGRYLAAVPRGADKLMLFDFPAQRWTEAAKTEVNSPAWLRHSRYIYYFDNYPVQKEPALLRLRLSDRFMRLGREWRPAWSHSVATGGGHRGGHLEVVITVVVSRFGPTLPDPVQCGLHPMYSRG